MMAIKLKAGATPKYGRITMPKGTYVSSPPKFGNPSTAGVGALGGMYGGMPPTPQIGLGQDSPYYRPPQQPNLFQSLVGYDPNRPLVQTDKYPAWTNFENSISRFVNQLVGVTPALSRRNVSGSPDDRNAGYVQPSNTLVGRDYGASPEFVTNYQVKQILSGMDSTQAAAVMASKGYTRSYQAGVGEVWIKTGEGTQENQVRWYEPDERGRPVVNPFEAGAQLNAGERVITTGGYGVTGGTPTAEGAAQYAVTIPGGVGDKYKWVSRVTRDADGNWVRVYQRKLRSVYTRSHRIKARQRELDQVSPVEMPIERNQLVNLRADFG